MGDIYDDIVASAALQNAPAPASRPLLPSGGDAYDQIVAMAATSLPAAQPTVGSNALQMLTDLPKNIFQGVKNAPATAYDMVTSIPSGINNLAHLPFDAAQIGADAVKMGYGKLTGDPLWTPTGTPEGSKEVYGRAERTLRGLGLLGVTAASGGLGAVANPIVTTAAAPTLFNKINQVVGNDAPTTAQEDIKSFEENLGANAALVAAGKATAGAAKALPEVAKGMDRASLGTRQSDYGRASELSTIMTPDGVPETYVKAQLDDLLASGKLGTSRNPKTLTKIVDKEMQDLSSKIDAQIKAYDETGTPAPHPSFDNALQYIYDGKVPANEIPAYLKRLDELDSGIAESGNGKLSFLQQQKIAVGKNYSTVDAVKAGFERQIYKDLQGTIEKVAPEVGGLNAELGKFMVAKPAINRSLLAQENASFAKKLADVGFTTGGIGASIGTGAVLGGIPGAILGAGVGVAQKAIRSNTGQATIAAGIRKLTGAGKEIGAVAPDLLIPPEWAVRAGLGASSQRIQDQNKQKREEVKAAVLAKYPELSNLFDGDRGEPRNQSAKNAKQIPTKNQDQKAETEAERRSRLNRLVSPSSQPTDSAPANLANLLKKTTGGGKVNDFKLLKTLLGGSMDAPQAEVRQLEDRDMSKSRQEIETEIDADPFLALAYQLESGRGKYLKNPESSASGPFQMINATAKAVGVNAKDDDFSDDLEGMKKLKAEYLEQGVEDDPIMLYGAHYLGVPTLKKWLNGGDLSDKQQKQVDDFKKILVPRARKFLSKYDQVKA